MDEESRPISSISTSTSLIPQPPTPNPQPPTPNSPPITHHSPLTGLDYFIDIYSANLKMATAMMAQYRFAILIWAVWGFVGPLISLAVWSAATAARGSAVSNGGSTFTRADFAAYFLVFMIFGHLTMSWDAFEF